MIDPDSSSVSDRKRREFDYRIQELAKEQPDFDRVVDLFASKLSVWNQKTFDQLVESNQNAVETKAEFEQDFDDIHHQLAVIVHLVNTTMQPVYRQHYAKDIVYYMSDALFGTAYMDVPFTEWSWEQTPFGIFCGVCLFCVGILMRYWDTLLAMFYLKNKDVPALTPAQQVRKLIFCHLKFFQRFV